LHKNEIEYGMPLVSQFCDRDERTIVYIAGLKECPRKNSYLNAFVRAFWYKDHTANGANFVTQYAATSPTEDIAESFTSFVLQRKPSVAEDIGDEKILFFYQYPELISARERIRASVAEYF
jgi:hypothetical protein